MKSKPILLILAGFLAVMSNSQQVTYRNVSYPCPMLTCDTPLSPLSVVQEPSRLVIQTAAAYRPIISNFS